MDGPSLAGIVTLVIGVIDVLASSLPPPIGTGHCDFA